MNELLKHMSHDFGTCTAGEADVTLALSNGLTVTGLLERVDDEVVSIRRVLIEGHDESYAEHLRHFRTDAVVGVWVAEGS